MENEELKEKVEELYETIKMDEAAYIESALESGLNRAETDLTIKAARELDKSDFISFLVEGEMSGTLSLTDEEMAILQGGGKNNNNSVKTRFCLCCW
jgi:hypothetical protein